MRASGRDRSNSAVAGIAFVILVLLAGNTVAFAVTRQWIGPANGNWFTSANWSPSGSPSASDDLRVYAGTPKTSSLVSTSNGGKILINGSGTGLTISNEMRVGATGQGTLTIEAGGQVSNSTGYLGDLSGSTGTATVTGSGSQWTNSDEIYVGRYGTGALNIEAGGQVRNTNGYLAYNSGSTGAAIVTGSGSQWTNSGTLTVGRNGSGALTVADGGLVTAGRLYAARSGLLGDGTITVTKGGIVDADLVFNATNQTTAAFGTGGTLNLTVDGTTFFGVGYKETGTLNIQAGAQVSNTYGFLGYSTGSTGTATVTGPGSRWSSTDELRVGNYGSGTLTIDASGQVSNANGSIGFSSDSTGTATVTGAGSRWTNTGILSVGNIGSGELTIEVGGQVSSTRGYLGYERGATGTATVTGTGSQWINTGEFCVGLLGSGTLTIEAGGQVSNTNGYLGFGGSVSNGAGTVTGSGSQWTNSGEFYVGCDGGGTLTVANGGLVAAQTLYASLSDLFGNGAITVTKGAVLDADLVFDTSHGTNQTLAFGTGGTLNLNVDGTAPLGVGYKQAGTLTIEAGRQVSNTTGYLGYYSGSTGTATVTGAGSRWTHTGVFFVARYGTGTLTIRAGGQVSNTTGYLGSSSGSTGTATVTGDGSQWNNSSSLYVGSSGKGVLNVADGGKVTARSLYINNQSAVRLLVSGSGMVVLGDAATNGSLTNSGKVKLYADSFLAAGTYTPITPYPGRTITWSGTGTYSAFGGTWDSGSKTFLVPAATALAAGVADTLTTGERLLFTDSPSGKRVGASFGAVSGAPTFSATRMGGAAVDALKLTPGFEDWVLSAWDFQTTYTGGEVLLSFDIGLGASDLKVWHYDSGAWSLYAADLLAYDSNGVVSFITSDFSGYAVTGVPEPASAALLLLGALAVVWRRRGAIMRSSLETPPAGR